MAFTAESFGVMPLIGLGGYGFDAIADDESSFVGSSTLRRALNGYRFDVLRCCWGKLVLLCGSKAEKTFELFLML